MNKLFFGGVHPRPHKELSALGKVDTLIANACECEPYITADDTLPHPCSSETGKYIQYSSGFRTFG